MTLRKTLLFFLGVIIATVTTTLHAIPADGIPTAEIAGEGAAIADTTAFAVKFRVGKSQIDPKFSDNAIVLTRIKAFLDSIKNDSARQIDKMMVRGSVSPEGSLVINQRLIKNRAAALSAYLRECGTPVEVEYIPSQILSREDVAYMASECNIPLEQMYRDLRNALLYAISVAYVVNEPEPGIILDDECEALEMHADEEPAFEAPVPEPLPDCSPEPECVRSPYGLHVKTNLLAWGMMISNFSIEYDIHPHLSVAIPVYYSGVNYFVKGCKFRTTTIQPELRYWSRCHCLKGNRWFVGAHFGIGWFNFALGGDYRYQDVGGHSPAMGGGISGGYRMVLPFGRYDNFKLEFTLGAGVYRAHYDKFYNYPNGPLYKTDIRKTWAGIDNAGVTLVYTFNL